MNSAKNSLPPDFADRRKKLRAARKAIARVGKLIVETARKQGIGTYISPATVIKRINRRLARNGEDVRVRAVRGERARLDLGDYFEHNARLNVPGETHIDLEAYARDLGVMRPEEALVI